MSVLGVFVSKSESVSKSEPESVSKSEPFFLSLHSKMIIQYDNAREIKQS